MTDATLEEPTPRPSYVARAFGVQYNLILIGGAGLFALALASPWPLVAGVLAELAWLGIGSNLGFVRRWLDRREALEEHPPAAPADTAERASFDRVHQHRLYLFDQALNELKTLGSSLGDTAYRRSLAELEQVRVAFEATCRIHQGLQRFLEGTPEAELTEEVARLKRAAEVEQDLDAKMGIRQALVLAKRRVEQRQGMLTELATLSLRLETLEQAVLHLVRQGRALGANAQLAAEIDALVVELGLPLPR